MMRSFLSVDYDCLFGTQYNIPDQAIQTLKLKVVQLELVTPRP